MKKPLNLYGLNEESKRVPKFKSEMQKNIQRCKNI